MNPNTIIISGFPGIGKTFLAKYFESTNKKVLDSDSSLFSWIEPGVRNPEFPDNYIKHIKENIGKADIIFVSSHETVRSGLQKENITFVLVYPSKDLRDEYIQRYEDRNSDPSFIEMMKIKFDEFVDQCTHDKFAIKIELRRGQYLSDIIENIIDHKGVMRFDNTFLLY